MATITVTNLQGHTSGSDANKVKIASGQTLDVNGTLDVTGATITGNLPSANLTGALPAISGNALTNLDLPIDDHVRVTFSGPTVANNTVTTLTPTLQGETNGGFTIQNTNQIKVSVTGHYLVIFMSQATTSGSAGYTPISYIDKNGSTWASSSGIRYYNGSSTIDFPTAVSIVSMDSTSDYFRFRVYHNTGSTSGSATGTATIVRIGD